MESDSADDLQAQPTTSLVTGASSGIGLALARRFAADGNRLVLVARSEEKLAELAEELRQEYHVDVLAVVQDLSEPDAAKTVFDTLTSQGVMVDIVINNAGFGAAGSFHELPLQRQLDILRVNVVALTDLTRRFLPGMVERGRGGILNIASTAAFQPGPGMAVYFATKAYVLSFTEALAEELRGSGVTASCLAPGPTVTGFSATAEMQDSRLFKLGPMSAEAVAAAGHRGFRRGKAIVVPGIGNKLAAILVRFAPRIVVRKVAKALVS